MWRNEWRIWFSEPYDNCTRCLKSSFLYGGSRHHKKLKIFIFEIPQFLKFFGFSNSSTLQNLQCFRHFSSLAIYIYIYEFMSSTAFTYSYFFKLFFSLLSECDRTLSPLCYTQPNPFTSSSCAFYLKLVQNLHCVLVSWRNCEWNFKTNLIQIFGFYHSNRSESHDRLIYSPTI